MRGPSLQYDLRIHRTWKCSACGRVVCTRGRETSKTCSCVAPPIFMQLIEAPRRLVFDATAFVSPVEPEIDEDGPDGLEEATAAAMAAILARAEASTAPQRSHYSESLARLATSPEQDHPVEGQEHPAEHLPAADIRGEDGALPPVSQERSSQERPSAERNSSHQHRIPRQRSRQGEPAREGSDRRPPRSRRRPTLPPAASTERDDSGSGSMIGDAVARTEWGDRQSSGKGTRSEPERMADGAGVGGSEPGNFGQKDPHRKSRRRRRQTGSTERPADAAGGPAASEAIEQNLAATDHIASPSETGPIRPRRPGRANVVPSSAAPDAGETQNEASTGSDNAPDLAGRRRSRRRGRRRGQRSGSDGSSGGSANGATEAE